MGTGGEGGFDTITGDPVVLHCGPQIRTETNVKKKTLLRVSLLSPGWDASPFLGYSPVFCYVSLVLHQCQLIP